jgi:hypothetical protein
MRLISWTLQMVANSTVPLLEGSDDRRVCFALLPKFSVFNFRSLLAYIFHTFLAVLY